MDHLEILINQHKSIRKLLHLAKESENLQNRVECLDRLKSEIELHTFLEEAEVYPVLENYDSLKRQVYGFWREHERLKQELHSLLSVHQDERAFQSLLSRIDELFEEHVREEENHIFPEARKLLNAGMLEKLEQDLKSTMKQGKMAA